VLITIYFVLLQRLIVLQLPHVTAAIEIPYKSNDGQLEPFLIAESSIHPKGLYGFIELSKSSQFVPNPQKSESASLFILPNSEDYPTNFQPQCIHIHLPVRASHFLVIPSFSSHSFLLVCDVLSGDADGFGRSPSMPRSQSSTVGLFEVAIDQMHAVRVNDLTDSQSGPLPFISSDFLHPPLHQPVIAASGRHALLVASNNVIYSLSLKSLEWSVHFNGQPIREEPILRAVPTGTNEISLFFATPFTDPDGILTHRLESMSVYILIPKPQNRQVELRLAPAAVQTCFFLDPSKCDFTCSCFRMAAVNGAVVVLEGNNHSGRQTQPRQSPLMPFTEIQPAAPCTLTTTLSVLRNQKWEPVPPNILNLELLQQKDGKVQLVYSARSDRLWIFVLNTSKTSAHILCMHSAANFSRAFECWSSSSGAKLAAAIPSTDPPAVREHCLNCHIFDPKMKCSRCKVAK
jgi:hypothetical protein